MKDYILKDEKGRELIRINKGKIAVARYVDMDEKVKKMIIEIFCKGTGQKEDKIRAYMDFNTDEGEFCT